MGYCFLLYILKLKLSNPMYNIDTCILALCAIGHGRDNQVWNLKADGIFGIGHHLVLAKQFIIRGKQPKDNCKNLMQLYDGLI